MVNARHVKNLPGRKTDVSDATWLAQLGAHGLVSGSFVPPEPIRQLRDLTRARTAITRERGREAQRLEKLLEDAGIKLSAANLRFYAADVLGVSGRAMLEAMIAGDLRARLRDLTVTELATTTAAPRPGATPGVDTATKLAMRSLGQRVKALEAGVPMTTPSPRRPTACTRPGASTAPTAAAGTTSTSSNSPHCPGGDLH